MRIIVRSKERNLWIPIPTGLIGGAIALMPQAVLLEIRKNAPEQYGQFVTKEYLKLIYMECRDIINEYKGLEIVHVETQDGTYVSIKL